MMIFLRMKMVFLFILALTACNQSERRLNSFLNKLDENTLNYFDDFIHKTIKSGNLRISNPFYFGFSAYEDIEGLKFSINFTVYEDDINRQLCFKEGSKLKPDLMPIATRFFESKRYQSVYEDDCLFLIKYTPTSAEIAEYLSVKEKMIERMNENERYLVEVERRKEIVNAEACKLDVGAKGIFKANGFSDVVLERVHGGVIELKTAEIQFKCKD